MTEVYYRSRTVVGPVMLIDEQVATKIAGYGQAKPACAERDFQEYLIGVTLCDANKATSINQGKVG